MLSLSTKASNALLMLDCQLRNYLSPINGFGHHKNAKMLTTGFLGMMQRGKNEMTSYEGHKYIE